MAKSNRTSTRSDLLDPFDDRVDTLFGELDLAIRWMRPSILLAVYRSEFIQADIERLLNARLAEIGIKVAHILVTENQFDIPLELIKQSDIEKTVFFVSGLKWGGGRSGRNAYRALNIRREYLVDHKIRALFWLNEDEAAELPFRAPDFWAFRHRVVEFLDHPPILYSARIDGVGPARNFFTIPKEITKDIETQEALFPSPSVSVEATPDDVNQLLSWGNIYWLNGKFEEAAKTLLDAISLAKSTTLADLQFRAWVGLGVVRHDMGLLSESAAAFECASRVDSQSVIPWLYLAVAYSKLGTPRRALFAARKASRMNPRSAEAWLALGNLYTERDNFSEAVAAFQVSLALERNNPMAWEGLGRVYLDAGDFSAAILAYEKALKFAPEDGNVWGILSLLYRDSGDLRKACKAAKRAVEKAPQIARNWLTYGSVLAAQGRNDKAITAYSQAASIDASEPFAIISLANCYLNKGDLELFNHWHSLASTLFINGDDYVKASFYALTRDHRALLKHLKRALKQKKVSPIWLQQDSIFGFMHNRDDFQSLFKS